MIGFLAEIRLPIDKPIANVVSLHRISKVRVKVTPYGLVKGKVKVKVRVKVKVIVIVKEDFS